MDSSYLILVICFVLSLSIRSAYERLKDAGKLNPANKPLFIFIFCTMCALWVCWFSLCPLDPYRSMMPEPVRWGGLALFALGMVLALGALFQLKGLENIDHLVTSGFFAKLRHPMYTGFMLWILGWSAFHYAWLSLFVGLFGIAHILYWRKLEDTRLLARYGETYKHYRSTTWF
jgi:protein-S-isoprenylcysteine O-methyltransferase Ste14